MEFDNLELVFLETSLKNELAHRERMAQEIGLSEEGLNIPDLRKLLQKIQGIN